MRSRIIRGLIIAAWLFTSCSSPPPQELPVITGDDLQIEPTLPPPQELSVITWDDLQIEPRQNDNLCPPEEDIDWERFKQDFPPYGLFNMVEPEERPNRESWVAATQWVEANKPLAYIWRFWYPEGNESPATLRLFVLLDERQLDDVFPEPGKYTDLNFEPGDEQSVRIKIPPLSPGIHDVTVVGIPYPQNTPNVYGLVKVVDQRITLIAGETPSPPFRKIQFVNLPAEGSIRQNAPHLIGIVVTLKKDGTDVWNWPNPWLDVGKNEPINFFALTGHQDVLNEDAPNIEPLKNSFAAFLLFVDYRQIDIVPGQAALYTKMDSDTAYARIPITIPPLPSGKHHILILRINTPGVPVCMLWNDDGRILPFSVDGSLVGINVIPSEGGMGGDSSK